MIVSAFAIVIVAVGISTTTPYQNSSNQTPPTNYKASASPNLSPIAEAESYKRQRKHQNPNASIKDFLSWCERNDAIINLASAIAVAIFTGALTWYTVKLYRSGERHSERELRAYVYPTKAGIHKSTTQPLMRADLEITNSGQTPAYDLTIVATFDFTKLPRTEFKTYEEGEVRQSSGTIGPGIAVNVPLVAQIRWTEEYSKAVQEERFACFLYGTIKYTDAFGEPRFTHFRYIAGKDEGGTLAWRICEEGNKSN